MQLPFVTVPVIRGVWGLVSILSFDADDAFFERSLLRLLLLDDILRNLE